MKTLSGFIVCDCDARYRPRMVQRPNAYFVQCQNCGERTPDVDRPPYASHIAAQEKAQQDWNDGKRL